MIQTDITHKLAQTIDDPSNLIERFGEWKSAGETGENDFYLFGKDGAYTPTPPKCLENA